MTDEKFDLVAAKMLQIRSDMIAHLNADLFRPGELIELVHPPTRWQRWRWRVKDYLSTLWLALKGHDFESWDDY